MDPEQKKKLPSWLLLRNEEKFKTESVVRSPVLDRAKEFLPEIANANELITEQDKGCLEIPPDSSDSESEPPRSPDSKSEPPDSESEPPEKIQRPYVEMNVGLVEYGKEDESDSDPSSDADSESDSGKSSDSENSVPEDPANAKATDGPNRKRKMLIEELENSEFEKLD